MQNINQVVTNLFPDQSKAKPHSTHTSPSLTAKTRKVLAGAWEVLRSRRLVHSQVGSIEHRTFERDMSDLSEQEIRNGLERCKDFTGFFSTPAFRELCKTVDLQCYGLPEPRAAYQEACLAPKPKVKARWSHPAVYQAGIQTGWFELASMPTDDIYPRFAYNYDLICKRVIAGEDITVPVPEAIPEKINAPMTQQQKISQMESLREGLGI